MNQPDDRPTEREIALGLAHAMERALTTGGSALDLKASRDVAQILVLDGLDRLLQAFEPHVGGTLPTELMPARDRLLRMALRAIERGDIEEFRSSGAELEAIAGELNAIEWSSPMHMGRDVATVPAWQALEDLTLSSGAAQAIAHNTRLLAPVAATLRAALDWLAGPDGWSGSIELHADDSLLEVQCVHVDPNGLDPARRVLAEVDGSIGPALHASSGWMVRVPAVAARDHFLMIERGRQRIALPWHVVLRLLVLPANAVATRAKDAGMTLLHPFPLQSPAAPERPVVMIAHGARRAWLEADRLVWRLPAIECEPDDALRGAGFDRAVRTDEGDVYGVAPVSEWLASVPEPAWPITVEPLNHEQLIQAMPSAPESSVAEIAAAAIEAAPLATAIAIATESESPTLATATTPATESPAIATATATATESPALATAPAPAPIAPAGLFAEMPRPRARIMTDIIAPEPFAIFAAPISPAPLPVAPAPASPPAPTIAVPVAPAPELRILTMFEVEPLDAIAPIAPIAPLAPIAPIAPIAPLAPIVTIAPIAPPATATRLAPSPAARQALVAEDSLVASVFLSRLLEQLGFSVTIVTRASELDGALHKQVWSLVCVDAELPDARGVGFLRAVRERAERRGAGALVALIRDREDRAAAEQAGLHHHLRKPVEPEALRALLARIDALAAGQA